MTENIIIKKEIKKLFPYNNFNVNKLKKHNIELYYKIIERTKYITSPLNFNERIYHIINDIYSIPTCKLCNNFTKFININKGYSIYCNIKCSNSDIEAKENRIKKMKNTYKNNKENIIMKIKKTNLIRYGDVEPNNTDLIKSKIKKTNKEKYGVEHNSYNTETIEKRKQTNINKYGESSYFKTEEFKNNKKQNNIDKYGVEYYTQTDEYKNKYKETCLKKYGVENIAKIRTYFDSSCEKTKNNFLNNLFEKLELMNLTLLDKNYINNLYDHKWKCKKCNFTFINKWRDMCRGYLCPKCYPRITTSSFEKEIYEFFINIGICKNKISLNNRKVIYPKELDIYIPEKNIAIEFNGLYWHSEEKIGKHYHYEKTIICQKNNIRLVHIFEDEWIFKQDIVKERLKHILGLNNNEKIYARKCIIKEIDSKTKNEFLEQFHLQGKDISKINLGSFYNNMLIAVMTFSKGNISKGSKSEEGVWELNRFCSDYNYNVIGIAGKLLKYFQRNYHWKEIFSYADRRWSDGNLYYKLGLKLQHMTKPNYWYIKNYQRIHRFNLRKRPNEPKELTEFQLRLQEGYSIIWDCGSYKFNIKNSNYKN